MVLSYSTMCRLSTCCQLHAVVQYELMLVCLLDCCCSLLQVGAGRRVFELMDRTPQMPPSGTLKPTGSPSGAAVQFQSVYFSYPSRPGSWVLKDFTLTINPGQTVALVGSSGGGKSTVVKLVQRFYDPQRGSVMFDGVDLKEIDRMYLHQQVALVAQEPLIFAESIKYNIMFGVHRKDITEVRQSYLTSLTSETCLGTLLHRLVNAVLAPADACRVRSYTRHALTRENGTALAWLSHRICLQCCPAITTALAWLSQRVNHASHTHCQLELAAV